MEHGMNLNVSFFFELSNFNMHYTLPCFPCGLPLSIIWGEFKFNLRSHLWVKKTEDCTRDELFTMLSSNFKRVDCTVHTNKQGWGWLSTNTWNIISMLVVQGSFVNTEITDK